MMDLTNGWLDTLNYPIVDHQPQTYVTKHDLELLHKKIIATDLIVQKYQDANRALVRLQDENENLKQKIVQITNECCIFGRQVTECTQECDLLKEQIESLNNEKRDLHQQLRLLQDENTNSYHEIMVLRQYESLKEKNDQLTIINEQQHKKITKLKLIAQRQSPIVCKQNKDRNEPSETDFALRKAQTSVHELKLALARLMGFVQAAKIELPSALNIRPILKAHDIQDDFLESVGEYVCRPVKKKVAKPVPSQTQEQEPPNDDDNDDDDDQGDFIDVTHSGQSVPVNKTVATTSINVVDDLTKQTPKQSKKKKEKQPAKAKSKPATRSRRQKDADKLDDSSTKLDDLANELDMAISQPTPQPQEQESSNRFMSSFLSDDDEDERTPKSDKQSSSFPVFTPISLQPPIMQKKLQSTITILDDRRPRPRHKDVSSLSDDERMSPIVDKPTTVAHAVRSNAMDTTNMQESSTKYTSFLSEDDDDNRSQISNLSSLNNDNHQLPASDKPATMVFEPSLSFDEQLFTNKRSTPTMPLDSQRLQSVLSLLNYLTQSPIVFKRLRLVHRRKKQKSDSQEQILTVNSSQTTNTETISETMDIQRAVNTEESASVMEEDIINENATANKETECTTEMDTSSVSEQPSVVSEEINIVTNEVVNQASESTACSIDTDVISQPDIQYPPVSIEQPPTSVEEVNAVTNEVLNKESEPMEDMDENTTTNCDSLEDQTKSTTESEVFVPIQQQLTVSIMQEEPATVQHPAPPLDTTPKIVEKTTPTNETIIQHPNVFEKKTRVNPPKKDLSYPSERLNTIEKPLRKSIYQIRVPPKATPKQSVLKPSQVILVKRLLDTLIRLPIKPLVLPMPYPSRKRSRKPTATVQKRAIVSSTPVLRSTNRMPTRSLTAIRACIARSNQAVPAGRKRTATQSISSLPPIPKRRKTKSELNENEYDRLNKFVNTFSKQIDDDMKNFLQQKLNEDILSFHDNVYRIFSELMIYKCDIILPLVKNLHPLEESIKLLLQYIHSQSTVFQQHFIARLKQGFEYEIKQQHSCNKRIKILNRLFFVTCSIVSTSAILTYARLFDIGYHLSHDIFVDALSFISNTCESLMSIDAQTKSANVLLHQVLLDLSKEAKVNVSLAYLENLIVAFHKFTHDEEDLLRSFILISRHQTWPWCSNELCSKFLFPLWNKVNDQQQNQWIILTIVQHVLFIYKDDENFKRDTAFHNQTKQLMMSLKTNNSHENTVRDKIFFILRTCS